MIGQPLNQPGPQIHRIDIGVAAIGVGHDDAFALRREAWREGHPREVAENLLAAAVDIENVDPRLAAKIGEIGDLLPFWRKAGGEDEVTAVS